MSKLKIKHKLKLLWDYISTPLVQFEWKTDVRDVFQDNYMWQSWTQWNLSFGVNKVWFEDTWYDGPHRTVFFGIGSLYWAPTSNYHERVID